MAGQGGDRRSANFKAGKRPLEIPPPWKQAGFSSRRAADRARKVSRLGCDELIAAMDSGAISISAAAILAELPEPEQRRILASPRPALWYRVRELRREREETSRLDKITIPMDAQRTARILIKRWPPSLWRALAEELLAQAARTCAEPAGNESPT
jgi:hypothetical protein